MGFGWWVYWVWNVILNFESRDLFFKWEDYLKCCRESRNGDRCRDVELESDGFGELYFWVRLGF